MVDEAFCVRDEGVITLVVPLTIWRGATQALNRGKVSILLGLTVFTAYQVFHCHEKQPGQRRQVEYRRGTAFGRPQRIYVWRRERGV